MTQSNNFLNDMIEWSRAAKEATQQLAEQASKMGVIGSAARPVRLISSPASYGLSSSEVHKQLAELEYTQEDRHIYYHSFGGRFAGSSDEFDAGFLNYMKNIRNRQIG